MEGKIRAIVKRTDEKYGHMTNISGSLENLQQTVGGYIEPVFLYEVLKDDKWYDLVILCDEEGKLKNKEPNMQIYGDVIVGDLIVLGAEGEDFCDVPVTFEEWKSFVWRCEA